MSVDVLQKKIRKVKNPAVVLFEAFPELLPPHVLEEAASEAAAIGRYCGELLESLREQVCAVRFGFGSFALLGPEGLEILRHTMEKARVLGYYVLMDMPEILSPDAARRDCLLAENFPCDGVVIGAYLGSDAIRPFCDLCAAGKSVFAVVRTSNKSAPELQDLLTGSRLVHTAAADIINRLGQTVPGKCGYSGLGAMAAAGAADSLRSLRSKYPQLFLLVEGYDYPSANAKNCSFAFDKLGHGAAVCTGSSITAAWKEAEAGEDYRVCAVKAAERMKKNLGRYITIL